MKIASIICALFLSLWAWPSALIAQNKRVEIKSTFYFPEGKDRVVIKWKWAGSIPMTNAVKVNGKSLGWFAIDTGANCSGVTETIARQMRLPPVSQAAVNGVGVTIYNLDELNVNGVRITQHAMVSIRHPLFRGNFVGLIGGDVLGKAPFAIDYQKQTLTIFKRSAFTPPKQSIATDTTIFDVVRKGDPLRRANPHMGVPLIRGFIDGVPATMLIDTASGITALMPNFTSRHKQFVSDKPFQFNINKTGMNYKAFESRHTHLTILGHRLPKSRFSCAHVGQDVVGHKHDVIVGTRVLRNFQWWFDYKNKTIWSLWKPYPSVRQRLATGLDPNFIDLKSTPLLNRAVKAKDAEGVKALIESGAKLESANSEGLTALHYAVILNQPTFVDLLIQSGAKADSISKRSETALHIASKRNHAECIARLLAAGADPNAYDKDGTTPLFFSIVNGNAQAVKAMLKAGAHWQIADPKQMNDTAYHLAAIFGHAEIIRLIHASKASHKPSVNKPSTEFNTPLVIAILENEPEAVKALLEIGANPHAPYRGPITILDLAKTAKDPKIRKLVGEAAKKKKSE